MKTEKLKIRGMHCTSCEKRIEDALKGVQGVAGAKASFAKGEVELQLADGADIKKVEEAVKKEGYSIGGGGWFWVVMGVAAMFAAAFLLESLGIGIGFPTVGSEVGYAALFILGLATGFHCIAMCGGFVLGYSSKSGAAITPHILYGAGKLLSYTFIGAVFGLIGSAIAFTPEMRAGAALLAGIFLLLYGLGMLGISGLAGIRFGMPKIFGDAMGKLGGRGPLVTGLLNGLMIACGPLQAMYIFAAGTGSVMAGGTALFFFGLGTLPVMLGFGIITARAGGNVPARFASISGWLVIFLGVLLLNQGLTLAGSGVVIGTGGGGGNATIGGGGGAPAYQEIHMNVTYYGFEPNEFTLKKGVPVRWVINGVSITSCNNRIIVPAYGLEFDVRRGEQVIEFTPTETGEVRWSCWMGMIPGKFVVVE
ncbi:MAG: sulfite exporter TauE/SafE family protein [Candidatus Micrarchaeia archaeon]